MDVVHVLVDVLEKVHRSLRPPGILLIIQPHRSMQRIEVEVQGDTVFTDTLYGPNFSENLAATRLAIDTVVAEGLFAVVDEIALPDLESFESVDEWTERGFLFDGEEASFVAARIRSVLEDREHTVKLCGDEYTLLLRKGAGESYKP
jgi:SAM-dependent methyltransferase